MGVMTKVTLGSIVCDSAAIWKPPERLTVTEAAVRYRKLKNPPIYEGPYKASETPYMIEPQNMTMSPVHKGVIFCGPSQSGKTESVILNSVAYVVKCSPMDGIVFGPTAVMARDFAKRRIDRMHTHSAEIGEQMLPGQHNDNTHDKTYKSGMILTISWPSVNEAASKPVPIVWLTEYDRMPDDVDGEGSMFVLAKARTISFRNLGMIVVDSSPSRPITDTKKKLTEHEAPPCTGVLGLYNEGDRRRWKWPCPHCGEFFEGSFKLLVYNRTRKNEDGDEIPLTSYEMGESVYMACPNNGCVIEPVHKVAMNARGVWLREGEHIKADGTRYGTPRRSQYASYWLKGTAAAYVSWAELVVATEDAIKKFEDTGTDEDLKTVINTLHGEPYVPKANEATRLPEDLQNRAVEGCDKTVPLDVRALFACVDVQDNRFEVQVMGIKPGNRRGRFDVVVIDRFPIKKSEREDEDGHPYMVRPSAYPEDWDKIQSEVMEKTYPLAGKVGEMRIAMTFCDSGGRAGATTNAYAFWRKLRLTGDHKRFHLVKGTGDKDKPRVQIVYPDNSGRKDRHVNARGEIPVLLIQTNLIKDTLNGMLDRTEAGGGMIQISKHFEFWFFEELCREVRDDNKGAWLNPAGRRNEAWDLLVYFLAGCRFRKVEQVDWEDPPSWLHPWASNPLVTLFQAQKGKVDKGRPNSDTFAALAGELA